MRVLVACEFSGVVSKAFRDRGHEAYSCDTRNFGMVPSEWFLEGDVRQYLGDGWDLMIAHPPCTYLTVAGNRYYAHRTDLISEAVEFVLSLYYSDIPRVCIENPVGRLSTLFRKPDQIIQPYEFGEDASKKTCLWLKNLPPLEKKPDQRVTGRFVNGVERWSNQTDSGQNRLPPAKDRSDMRSITYKGIASAMAENWGSLA